MRSGKPPAPEGDGEQITALIKLLHDTGERLEQITAGEVDSVTDASGRTVLLRRAQDRLRHSEAARQSAILDALPSHIALLDAQGCIVSVNRAWRSFATANALRGPQFAIGVNYIDLCERARGEDAPQAHQAAAGIRALLDGTQSSFSLEYACHSPSERRWFLLTATPLGDPASGVVLMHLDITEPQRHKEALQRFRAAMDVTADAIYLVDRTTMRFVHVNDTACRMLERSRAELLAIAPHVLLGVSRAALEQTYDALIARGAPAEPLELQRQRQDGSTVWVELRRHALHDGDRWTIVTLVRDVTERRKSLGRYVQLNRVHAMLSGSIAHIMRARTRDELFREACRIAVEAGGFRMAWIGVVDPGSRQLLQVAAAGDDAAFLAKVKERFAARADAWAGSNMTALALREKRPVASNDSQQDPAVLFTEQHAAAGVRSMAVVPLIVANQAVGVVALYADEVEFFHEGELNLLAELASEIAFAIDNLGKQERLDYLAYYDVLTGLANRTLFLERVAQYVRDAARHGHGLAVFLVDLERFRNVNDSLGRPAGDAVLRQAAQWLTRRLGDANLLARLDADHFAVVLPQIRPEGNVVGLLEKTLAEFQEHAFRLEDAVFRVAAKAGAALFPVDGAEAESLLRNAEAALKKAKTGGDRYRFYTRGMTDAGAGNLTLENQLRRALDNEEFILHYQPKIDLASGALAGAEALIRWNDPATGLVPPGRFIPVLEETGLINEVGHWAMRKALADYMRWRAAGLPVVRMSVNVSPLQLRHRGFVTQVKQAIGSHFDAAAGLELEITESLIMEDVRHNLASLQALRALGVTIAIDDFGTGYSSLSYLARLPVDNLKIDRSFIVDMTVGASGLALVSAIIGLAHALKIKVVAEGVETEEQSRLLRVLNCDEVQGFLYSQPLPRETFESSFLQPLVRDA
jgi:diguanylate cyclase (GGDEF)-like protein/PAS domain S-box-containing protein